MKHFFYLISMFFILFNTVGCEKNAIATFPIPEPKPDPEPIDPLARVVFRVSEGFIIKDAYSTDTLYNIDENYIRTGASPSGTIKYLIDEDFIYQGSEAKGKPIYLHVKNTIYDFSTYKAKWWKSDSIHYVPTSGQINYPISNNSGEVMFNIDGGLIRKGRAKDGDVMFTVKDNKYYLGKSNRLMFTKDEKYIRKGSSKEIMFTIKGDYLCKGTTDEIVFRITDDCIRKGRLNFMNE